MRAGLGRACDRVDVPSWSGGRTRVCSGGAKAGAAAVRKPRSAVALADFQRNPEIAEFATSVVARKIFVSEISQWTTRQHAGCKPGQELLGNCADIDRVAWGSSSIAVASDRSCHASKIPWRPSSSRNRMAVFDEIGMPQAKADVRFATQALGQRRLHVPRLAAQSSARGGCRDRDDATAGSRLFRSDRR